MTSVVITGGHGFLGWHTACRSRALHGVTPRLTGRREFASVSELAATIQGVPTVIHLAGVNRADSDDEVEQGNIQLAETLAHAIVMNGEAVHIVYANSVQSRMDNAYGRGKRQAAASLAQAARQVGGTLADIVLPNLFGEHGRPGYNSFVATFCHEVAQDGQPVVHEDRQIPLLHAQDAAAALLDAVMERRDHSVEPGAEAHGIAEVLGLLDNFHALYSRGEIPDLATKFNTDLFNTYRSYAFPRFFPISPAVHSDARGDLFETVRSHGGRGQAFVSTTAPGATRGEHYHLHKVERFFVLSGEAEIQLRRLLHDDVVTFRLSGEMPSFVDMPTMWVHNIKNVGKTDLVTMFWADQLLDPMKPDQYPEKVRMSEVTT